MPLTYGNGTSVVTLRPWTRCNLALDSGTCRKGFQTGQLKQGLVSDQDWMKGGHVRVSAGVKRLLIPADHSLSRIFCNRWRTSAQTATDQRLTVARSDLSTAGYTGGAAVNRSACANAFNIGRGKRACTRLLLFLCVQRWLLSFTANSEPPCCFGGSAVGDHAAPLATYC